MRLGRGWAPEIKEEKYSGIAIRELRTLLKKIFDIKPKKGLIMRQYNKI